jgi:hypothetical protein
MEGKVIWTSQQVFGDIYCVSVKGPAGKQKNYSDDSL